DRFFIRKVSNHPQPIHRVMQMLAPDMVLVPQTVFTAGVMADPGIREGAEAGRVVAERIFSDQRSSIDGASRQTMVRPFERGLANNKIIIVKPIVVDPADDAPLRLLPFQAGY